MQGPLELYQLSRYARAKPLVLAGYYLAMVGLLSAAGYPSWRVIAVAVVLSLSIGSHLFAIACVHARRSSGELPRRVHPGRLRGLKFAGLGHVAIINVAFALTGGLQSPTMPASLTPLLGSLVMFGRGPETRTMLGFIGLGTLVQALLPEWVRGPVVAQPYGMAITAASLFTALTVTWLSLSALLEAFGDRGKQLHRVGEQMVEAAMARARGLEQVGSKVAHELKNPLAAVKGLVQLLGRSPSADPRSLERLAVVEKEIGRMEEILADYLSFARPLEELKTGEIDLSEVSSDVLAVLEARAQSAGVRLSTTGNAQAYGDPRRIKEAMLNLVANALEATPEGGSVVVALSNSVCGGARVTIKDSGKGMSADVLEKIGRPFFTTRPEGVGLGVTLARNAFLQHGGDLSYESAPGVGTTVTAFIPNRLAQRPRHLRCGEQGVGHSEAKLPGGVPASLPGLH
jgi:two-component system, NtrC family, sensor histidine kinase HydH